MKKLLLVLMIISTSAFSQITNRIFTIGNSVTDGINFAGFQALANQRGNNHLFGRHMIPGSPLYLLYNSTASGFNADPYGYWPTAFGNYDWDCISFQPFDRGITGTDGDFTTIQKWADYIKASRSNVNQVQFYIYSRYPRVPQGKTNLDATADDWNRLWLGTYGGGETNEQKSYFINLLNTVRNANLMPKPANLVPVGDVMHALNQKMGDGKLTGYAKIWDFYSDGIHVNNVGSFTLGATFFATMYKQDPRGLTVPSQYGTIPDAIKDTILQTIYNVVFTHSFSGASLADIVPPTGISISPNTASLSFLQSVKLIPTVTPTNASNKNVSWVSSNTSIASVDNKGKVIGVGTGIATITGTSNEGGFSDRTVITVAGLANFTSVTGILTAWDFNGRTVTGTYKATSVLQGVDTTTGLNVVIGTGLTPSSFDNNGFTGSSQDTRSLSASLAAGEYIGFSLKAKSGKLLNINSISFNGNSQNRSRVFALYSSLNGFTGNNYISTFLGTGALNITTPNHSNISQLIEFRIYMFYAGPDPFDPTYESTGIGSRSGDDLVINGDILTPIDNEKPTSVTGILASQINENGFLLSWNESTDNMIVTGYNVYRNGLKMNSTLLETPILQITSLTSGMISNLTVTAVDYVGNESIHSLFTVITNRKPIAALNASTLTGVAPLTVSFTSTGSTDPDTDSGDLVLGFDWDFGNGQISTANSSTQVYTMTGIYTVSLKVVDTRNLRSDFVYATITVVSKIDTIPVTDTIPVVDTITGLHLSQSDDQKINIYPNPVQDILTIQSPANLVITDLIGTIVWHSNEAVTQVDMSSFSSGFYIVKINNMQVERIIKQ